MALIVIKTAGIMTGGAQHTYGAMLAKLIEMWGKQDFAYFDVRLITEGNLYGQEEGAYFRKDRGEEAFIGEDKIFSIRPIEGYTPPPSPADVGLPDHSMNLATINLHAIAIRQLAEELPEEERILAREEAENIFKAI